MVIKKLLNSEPLESKYKNHKMTGKWDNFYDCHIEPDWVLIYKRTRDALFLERTGFPHSELFK